MPRPAAPSGRGSRSCDDDELSGRVIRFHGSVCLGNLIEAVHVIDGYDGVAGGDGVEKLLRYSLGQISGVAAVGGKAYAARDVVDRLETYPGPFVGQHSVEE